MVAWLLQSALAVPPPDFNYPNSLIGVSGGTPSVLSVRGEAWISAGATLELGVGVPIDLVRSVIDGEGTQSIPPTFDTALRWRPRSLCFGCGTQNLLSLGIGLGAVVTPDLTLLGPWQYTIGPDLAITGVHWFSPTVGVQMGGRLGAGPQWQGYPPPETELGFWAFGTLGLAF